MAVLRITIAVLLALCFTLAPPAEPPPAETADPPPVRTVAAARVRAVVPSAWEARPLRSGVRRQGLEAASNLDGWNAAGASGQGLEAYWVDAAEVGVPTDYYYLAAQGPAMHRIEGRAGCRVHKRRVLLDERPSLHHRGESPGSYVAVVRGTCRAPEQARTRWSAFVAAPGFGPVRTVGIPESGMYYAMVMVPDGPGAGRQARDLLQQVSFDDTTVTDLIAAARTGAA